MPEQDVTKIQFLRQLTSLGCERFELGVLGELTQKMVRRRDQRIDQLIKSISWLKYKNCNSHHIYIRPEVGEAVVLIDDLSLSNLLRMDRDGIKCACVVETSDLNFQAWVRVSKSSLTPEIATCLGEVLANRYDADLGSKDYRHFGRAAGFTNVKTAHQLENGDYPYSKIIESNGGVTPNGPELIKEAAVLRDAKKQERIKVRHRLANSPIAKPDEDVHVRFRDAVQFILDKYGAGTDLSRADASAAVHLLFEGYSVSDVERAMLASADIQVRRPHSLEDYVQRTIRWACDRGNVVRDDER